jgi:hypothetical protein
MNRPRRNARSSVLLVLAAALGGIGLVSVGFYAIGFLNALGDSDGSMAFWLLPFLLYGLAAMGVGTVLAVLWLLLVRLEADVEEAPGRENRR